MFGPKFELYTIYDSNWEKSLDGISRRRKQQKDPHYKGIFANVLDGIKRLECLMSLKVHYLNSKLDVVSKE